MNAGEIRLKRFQYDFTLLDIELALGANTARAAKRHTGTIMDRLARHGLESKVTRRHDLLLPDFDEYRVFLRIEPGKSDGGKNE